MKKVWIFLFIFLLFPTFVSGITVSSRSACLMDVDSGRVLFKKDEDNPRLIASITKIMTAILAIESNRLDEEVIVGEEVLKMYGSNIYIELGEKMSLRDLVYGLMLRSGNELAITE
ncbi:MAG: D-alanyl-D-alanine carboxypeptidase [Firmicutes bacterium]|nr:D-alanyl-D-alanine carboxypeptidase [Bacillota bacterium]